MTSRNEQRRALIEDRCARLEKLLASVAKLGTHVSPHQQDVGALERKVKQALSEGTLTEIADELTGLFGRLKSTPAADGEAIISPRRYDLFLSGSI